ncbi:MAG: cytochrome c [Deltaproteobacteria bacterium]|nr:MAG: cytochrome c [Deltaproteobacteria bacterium]
MPRREMQVLIRKAYLLTLFAFLFIGCVSNERMDRLYAQRCIGCHGLTGKGDGPTAAFLPATVPDFRETVQRRSVTQIRNIITKGKGMMPAYGPALSGREIQDMVLMVRFLSQLDRSPKWWERFEPLVWAHCTVPWEVVLGYDDPPEEDKR